jgi:hypothetical protein
MLGGRVFLLPSKLGYMETRELKEASYCAGSYTCSGIIKKSKIALAIISWELWAA